MQRRDDHLGAAVLYAAKSTKDLRGSIPTQLQDCRSAAEAEGREVVAEYSDEAASAFKGNRGSGLVRAKNDSIRLGAELWVQHSDRLARGDGITADHLAEVWFALRRHGVKLRSVQDDSNLEDAIRVVLIGERNNEDSKRKGAAVAAGQRRRFERGKRLGSKIRDGYRLDLVGVDARGNPIREVVLDPKRAPVWRRIFDLVEAGHPPGEVREILNAEGVRMKSGKPWTTRAIRLGVRDDFYAGRAHAYGETIQNDHEPLIDPERWERIAALVESGRSPRTQQMHRDWLLRGIASCGHCGERLYTRSDRHTYVCKAVRESRGTCEVLPIPAEQAEQLVLDHLTNFVGGVEGWLAQRVNQSNEERDQLTKAVGEQRAALRKLNVKVEKAREQWERLLGEDDSAADTALRGVQRLEDEADHLSGAMNAAEARLAEWPTAPDVDAALDYYNELRDAIRGRLSGSKSVTELRAHLRATLEVAALDYDGSDLFGAFSLRAGGSVGIGSGPGWAAALKPVELEREVMDTTS
jgi:site-specific DNA recombinase